MPEALVIAVFAPLANVPLAPEPGAVNVTTTPLTGDAFDVTAAVSCVADGVPTTALCPLPPAAAIDSTTGGGGVDDVEPPQQVRQSRHDMANMLA